MNQLRQQWRMTQLGQLVNDPIMKPFIDDLRQQIRDKMGQTAIRVGLTWEDLEAVRDGEMCLAMIQPDGDPLRHAMVLLVDVTDRTGPTSELLDKVDANMKKRGAAKQTRKVGDTVIAQYTITPKSPKLQPRDVFLFVSQQQLVAASDEKEALAILGRLNQGGQSTLSQLPAFQQVMARCKQAAGDLPPTVTWFVEPLGFARVARAASGGQQGRRLDRLTILAEQGFDAVQGIGGFVNLATGQHEMLHRTFVYAPPVKGNSDSREKYNLAFRMADFPNREGLQAQDWIPRELATYVTFNWRMQEAFGFSKTLVDAFLGEGFFDDFLASLRDDLDGPQIDIRKELVAHLGQRATFFSDNVVPITPESERLMLALELTDSEAVAANLNRALANDPYARKLDVNGHTIWEMLNEEEEEMPTVVIDGIGLTPIPGMDAAAKPQADGSEPRILKTAAIGVVHGQLIVTSQLDLMERIVSQEAPDQSLGNSVDYQIVNRALQALGAGEDSFRFFSRTDEEYRASYELIRHNQMPESQSLVGRLLNRLLGSDEDGVLRQQQIDGEKLPEYQVVRRYLGPAGIYVHSADDGWMVTGVMLSKDQVYDAQFQRPAITTASVPGR